MTLAHASQRQATRDKVQSEVHCRPARAPQSIADWCAKHSWDQKACRCIVSHESGGNANAVNENSNGSFDVGLWQVNS